MIDATSPFAHVGSLSDRTKALAHALADHALRTVRYTVAICSPSAASTPIELGTAWSKHFEIFTASAPLNPAA
jgi:hypothetical protein